MLYEIGQEIRNKIVEKGMTFKAFADKFGITDRNMQHFFKKNDITLSQVTRASEILEYDFVTDYINSLKSKGKADFIFSEPDEPYTSPKKGITVSLTLRSDLKTYGNHFSEFLEEINLKAKHYGFNLD